MVIFDEETRPTLPENWKVHDGRTDMLIAIPFGFLPRGKNQKETEAFLQIRQKVVQKQTENISIV